MSASSFSSSQSTDESSSLSSSAYMVSSQFNNTSIHQLSSDDEIASLPSETSTESDLLSEYDYSDAEEQWHESLQQLELLLTMVIVPFIGKYAGRRCAYWGMLMFLPCAICLTLNSAKKSSNVSISTNRLDQIYGMEVPNRNCHHR